MSSQTGVVISMGYVMLNCRSSKQKLDAKMSTEYEIIGNSDYVTFNVWVVMFLDSQGYQIKNNIIFQDSHSTISMAKNGRYSCTGNSKNINTRNFYVKGIVDRGRNRG